MNNITVPPIPPIQIPTTPIVVEEKNKRIRSELEKDFKKMVKDMGKVCYSYSRLSSIHQCEYEYYKNYIQWNRGKDNVYSFMGSIAHDTLEEYTNGKITKEEMSPRFDKAYSKAKLAGLKFPSDKIESTYIANLRLFFQDYEKPNADKIITEMFVCGVFGGEQNKIFMQGFIDEVYCYKDEDGNPYVVISDHKSSSKFKTKDLLKYGRQLAIYAHMYTKLTGVPVKYVQWNMMKYVECTLPSNWQKEFAKLTAKEIKSAYVEFGMSTEELKGIKKAELVEMGLQYKEQILAKYGFDDTSKKIVYDRKDVGSKMERHFKGANVSEDVIEEFKSHNLWSKLSDSVKTELRALGFDVQPYYEKYELTDEILAEMENYIIDTVELIENKESQPEVMYKPMDIMNDGGFYCTNLCGQKDNCQHYKQYVNVKLNL